MIRTIKAAFGLALVAAGCGESGPAGAPPTAHGGTLVGLPDDKGYAEIVRQDTPGQANSGRVVVYFLDPSRNPTSTPPAAASLKIRSVRGGKPIDLKPGEGGTMESPPIAGLGELEGEMKVTIDGKPLTVPLGGR